MKALLAIAALILIALAVLAPRKSSKDCKCHACTDTYCKVCSCKDSACGDPVCPSPRGKK